MLAGVRKIYKEDVIEVLSSSGEVMHAPHLHDVERGRSAALHVVIQPHFHVKPYVLRLCIHLLQLNILRRIRQLHLPL
jgi:hypothetical protein